MREITLDSLTDDQLQSESQLLVDMIRTNYPKLDLRRGTVLRDLLIDADAAVGALFAAQADEQRRSSSLKVLTDRSQAGEEVDQDDVNAVMSNFNMASVSGTKARGYVRIIVSSDSDHTVLAGVRFTTVDGVAFDVTTDTVATMNPVGGTSGQVKQYATGTDTFWYLVPVEAVENGSNGNIEQGLALESATPLADFVSASAYTAFSGGSDLENLDKTVDRIKESLSVRSLTTGTAVEAQLRDRYDDTENTIVAVSVCGYGNRAQLRDKHNLFGTAVGGRADVYVRNFTNLPIADNTAVFGQLESYDEESGTGTFSLTISHETVPSIISVYSVTDPVSSAISSYLFEAKYKGSLDGVWHDFQITDDDVHELANTVWRDVAITVKGVPVTEEDQENGGKMFRVVLVALPVAKSIQDHFDDGLVRNVAADYVVRGPMVVNVSVRAVVRYKYSTGFDKDRAVTEICSYVNNTGFVGRLTRSEISSLLIGLGAASVDLYDENEMLYGYVYDAKGVKHELSGDALDVDLIEDTEGMLTSDTAVFVVEPRNVQITTVAV